MIPVTHLPIIHAVHAEKAEKTEQQPGHCVVDIAADKTLIGGPGPCPESKTDQ